jgi:CHAT domain-containing protein
VSYFKKAQDLFLKAKNNYDYSWTFVGIGFAYYNMNDYDKALENFTKGLKTMNRVDRKVLFLDDIAAVYWMKKEYSTALQYYQKALSVAPIGFTSQTLFDNPTATNLKIADFKTYYLTTLQDKADTWLEYYESTKQNEHLRIALDTYLTADKLIDIMRFEHSGVQSKLYWRNKTHHLYEQAIKTCFLLKNYDKAFYFFEKSKAILLNDRLNELTAKQQLSPEDLAKEVDFQQKISELNKKLSAESENSEKYESLQIQVLDVQKQQEQFISGLETKNPTYFRYKYDTTLVSLDKVKKYLGNDQTLLEYFVGKNAIYALQVSDEKVNMYTIDVKNYADNATHFLSYCADNQKINKDFKGFLNVSKQLYEQMFTNITIPKGRLIIAQDGFFIPFEALSKSAQNSNYLLNDYAISYTYSMQFLLKNLGEKSFSIRHKFMGMSPVNFGENLNQTSLLGSDISLANITSNFLFGKNFNQNEATKRAFLTDAHNYQIVHLYTHAQADSSDQEPMIYFKDSVLKLSELSDLDRFKTQLMVLSACKTAVGKNAKGEGILSLSRGFAALGIPATLTTLWSVENQATYALNELFYRYLSKGYPKDVSLQKAKLEFLQSQSGEKQLPTFWAAAVLVGDAEAISFNNIWIYLLLGIVSVLGGFWWYQKK